MKVGRRLESPNQLQYCTVVQVLKLCVIEEANLSCTTVVLYIEYLSFVTGRLPGMLRTEASTAESGLTNDREVDTPVYYAT